MLSLLILKRFVNEAAVKRFWRRSPRWPRWTALSSADGNCRTTPAASSSCPPSAPESSLAPSPRWPAALSSHWWRRRGLPRLWGDAAGSRAPRRRCQESARLPPRAPSHKSTLHRCGSTLYWCRLGREWVHSGPELSDSVSDCLLSPEGATWGQKGRENT